jgi:hypothetical protein
MLRVITESWIYGYGSETKQQFALEVPRIPKTEEGEAEPQWDQEHAHRVFRHVVIVHHEFAPKGQTVNAEFYCYVLCGLREDVQ